MVFVRYDHRKLAYNQAKFNKKRRRSAFFNYDDVANDKTFGNTFGGTLGGGKQQASQAGAYSKEDRKAKPVKANRRGTIHISAHTRNQVEFKLQTDENDGGVSSTNAPLLARIQESFVEFEGGEGDVAEMDTLNNVMMHLEEKQKKRNQERMSEEFADIKSKLNKIFSDYGFKETEKTTDDENDNFDMRLLTDPDFVNDEDEEKNSAKGVIDNILEFYATVCQERSDILENVHDCMDIDEEEIENTLFKRLHAATSNHNEDNEIEDVSSEITMTIENIARKSQKLKRLYNKLLKLCIESKNDMSMQNNIENEAGKKVREINLQQKVVGQFKKLHTTKAVRKERVDTWKYAANEIVDLLQSVRQEGATDFERLEKEFKKILDAFNAQSELLQEVQYKMEKKDESLKKNEAIREKLRNDNLILQDDIDRYRVQNRTAQMKIQQLQGDIQIKDKEIKEKSEIMSKKLTILPSSNEDEIEIASNVISNIDNKELYDKINALQKAVSKYEKEIAEIRNKNRILIKDLEEMRQTNKIEFAAVQEENKHTDTLLPISNMSPLPRMPSSYNPQDCYECQTKQLKINKLVGKIKGLAEEKEVLIRKLTETKTELINNFDIGEETNISTLNLDEGQLDDSVDGADQISFDIEQKDLSSISAVENDSVEKAFDVTDELEADLENEQTLIPPPPSPNDTIVYQQEVYIEKTTLKTFEDKAIQVDNEIANIRNEETTNDEETNDEPIRFSDKVDNEISSIADKIFGFVNLAGKLTRKINRPKTSSQAVPTQNVFTSEDDRPATLPAISRNDMSKMKRENQNKNPAKRYVNQDIYSSSTTDSPSTLQAIIGHDDMSKTKRENQNKNLIKQNVNQEIYSSSTTDSPSTLPAISRNDMSKTKRENQNKNPAKRNVNQDIYSSSTTDSPSTLQAISHDDMSKTKRENQNKNPVKRNVNQDIYSSSTTDSPSTLPSIPRDDMSKMKHENQNKNPVKRNANQDIHSSHRDERSERKQSKQENVKKYTSKQIQSNGNDLVNGDDAIPEPQEYRNNIESTNHNSVTPKAKQRHADAKETSEKATSNKKGTGPYTEQNVSGNTKVNVLSMVPPSGKHEQNNSQQRSRQKLQQAPSQIHGDHDSMERSWTESGFFDDSSLNATKVVKDKHSFWHGQSNQRSGWNRLRYGRSHHVLRFLSRIAKSKCSLLSHESNTVHKDAKTAEEAVVGELTVFAEHAIDLLDIISFALKRIEIEHAEEQLETELATQVKNANLVTKTKETWKQDSSVAGDSDGKKVQFSDSNNPNFLSQNGETGRPRNSARHSARQHDVVPEDEDKIGRAARKRRQRILDRHKKLVERLRSSGVGMKQIYTILGISKGPNDEDEDLVGGEQHPVPPELKKAQQEQIRRMSLIGHSFNSAPGNQVTTPIKAIQEHPERKSIFPTMAKKPHQFLDTSKMYGNRKSFATNAMMKTSSLFPPIAIKTNAGATSMITNFFKTKPLANMR